MQTSKLNRKWQVKDRKPDNRQHCWKSRFYLGVLGYSLDLVLGFMSVPPFFHRLAPISTVVKLNKIKPKNILKDNFKFSKYLLIFSLNLSPIFKTLLMIERYVGNAEKKSNLTWTSVVFHRYCGFLNTNTTEFSQSLYGVWGYRLLLQHFLLYWTSFSVTGVDSSCTFCVALDIAYHSFHFSAHYHHWDSCLHHKLPGVGLARRATALVWCTFGGISHFGCERRGVSFDWPQPWMKRPWRESALSAPVTAACLIGPSPHRWHNMMGDDTEQRHVGSQMLAGGPRASKTLTDATL